MTVVGFKIKSPFKLDSLIAQIPYTLSRALNDALYDTRDKLINETFAHVEVAKGRGRRSPSTRRKESGRAVLKVVKSDEFGLNGEITVDLDKTKIQAASSRLTTAQDWVRAFVHSNAPVFSGKTKKERIRMALGAYYRNLRTRTFKEAAEKLDAKLYEERFMRLMLEHSLVTFPRRAKQMIKST